MGRRMGVLGCELPFCVRVQAQVYEAVAMFLERMPKGVFFPTWKTVDIFECDELGKSAIHTARILHTDEVVVRFVVPSVQVYSS